MIARERNCVCVCVCVCTWRRICGIILRYNNLGMTVQINSGGMLHVHTHAQ